MRRMLAAQALVLGCALVGCTSSPSTAPPDSPPAAGSSAGQGAATPTPSPSARTKAQDAADLKKALVTASDLGSPWTKPKTVSRVKNKKGQLCPGHVSAANKIPVNASAVVNLTEGRGTGKNIATFSLSTIAEDSEDALVAAYQRDHEECASYQDASGLFVVRTAEGPDAVDGTPVIAGWAERIYFDKSHKKLAYARHYLVTRQGRVLTYFSYAFLTVKKDPKAKDFGRASRLLEVQLAKNAEVIG